MPSARRRAADSLTWTTSCWWAARRCCRGSTRCSKQRFGRDHLRAWLPFEAVAYGACAFAAGAVAQSDFIVHDYAFITHDPKTGAPQYTVVVPRNTRFPTEGRVWTGQLVPTCSLGEAERLFKLVICEIGRSDGDQRAFMWDASGHLRKVGGQADAGTNQPIVVPLNESSPRSVIWIPLTRPATAARGWRSRSAWMRTGGSGPRCKT